MSLENVLNKIKENKENHNKGDYNCIPFVNLPRLEKEVPGIEKATFYLISASSGVK